MQSFTLYKYLEFFKQREDTEHEQAILRLIFCAGIALYVLLSPHVGSSALSMKVTMIASVQGVIGMGILAFIILRPQKSVFRRVLAAIADISALSYGLYIGGEWTQTLIWIYLFVIIGNGFRYGVVYLYASAVFSIVGIALASALNEQSALNIEMTIGYILGITIISFYLAMLLNRLNDAMDAANAANIAKSQFLANMSHEIRTPMNGVLGMLEISLSTNLSTETRQQLLIAKNSADALLVILNDILDLAKLDADKVTLESTDLNPGALAQEVVELLKPKAKEKQLALNLKLAPGLPKWVSGDPHRLRQVLLNLISNAIKFTEEGFVEISVDATTTSRQDIELYIAVTDTGIGVAEDKKNTIFEQFNQADESTTRKFGGTGLGLAISKMIVDKMGGSMVCDSVEGEGSVFSFKVLMNYPTQHDRLEEINTVDTPIVTARQIAAKECMDSSTKPDSTALQLDGSIKILVVEDNPVNQEVVKAMLKKLGCEVFIMDGGAQAVAYFTEHEDHRFNLILMDCQMPEMDGYETTEKLLSLWEGNGNNGNPEIPIVALTASALPLDKSRCFDVGMDDYLSKPVNLDRLFYMLVKWLPKNSPIINPSSHKTAMPLVKAPPVKQPKVRSKPKVSKVKIPHDKLLKALFDIRILQEVQSTTGDMFPEILESYRESSMQLVSEIEKQVSTDRDLLSKTLHLLKGSSASLGVAKLSELCQTIENQVAVNDSEEKIEQNILRIRKILPVTLDLMENMGKTATLTMG